MGYAIRVRGPDGPYFLSAIEAGKVDATKKQHECLIWETEIQAKEALGGLSAPFRRRHKASVVKHKVKGVEVERLDPRFTTPTKGWWPLENVSIIIDHASHIGRLVQIGDDFAIVAMPVEMDEDGLKVVVKWEEIRFPLEDLHRVSDNYNKRLRGEPLSG